MKNTDIIQGQDYLSTSHAVGHGNRRQQPEPMATCKHRLILD